MTTSTVHTRDGRSDAEVLRDDGLVIDEGPPPDAPARATVRAALVAPPPPARRYPPMNPSSVPSGLLRSVRLLTLARREPADPDTFRRFLAADTIVRLSAFVPLAGARAVDIGARSSYLADALCDQRASCVILDGGDGSSVRARETDASVIRGDGQRLPFTSGSLDIVHSAELAGVADPRQLLCEMTRVLRPGTGIGSIDFTNWRAPLRLRVGRILAWLDAQATLHVQWAGPRLWPERTQGIVRVPGLREIATGHVVVMFRRDH